jgi:hypothetical protein
MRIRHEREDFLWHALPLIWLFGLAQLMSALGYLHGKSIAHRCTCVREAAFAFHVVKQVGLEQASHTRRGGAGT